MRNLWNNFFVVVFFCNKYKFTGLLNRPVFSTCCRSLIGCKPCITEWSRKYGHCSTQIQKEEKCQGSSLQTAAMHDLGLPPMKMDPSQRKRPKSGWTPASTHTFVLSYQHWAESLGAFLLHNHQQQFGLISPCLKYVNHFSLGQNCFEVLHRDLVGIPRLDNSVESNLTHLTCQVGGAKFGDIILHIK